MRKARVNKNYPPTQRQKGFFPPIQSSQNSLNHQFLKCTCLWIPPNGNSKYGIAQSNTLQSRTRKGTLFQIDFKSRNMPKHYKIILRVSNSSEEDLEKKIVSLQGDMDPSSVKDVKKQLPLYASFGQFGKRNHRSFETYQKKKGNHGSFENKKQFIKSLLLTTLFLQVKLCTQVKTRCL